MSVPGAFERRPRNVHLREDRHVPILHESNPGAQPERLVRQLGAQHPQLLFELPAHIDEHVLGDGVKCAEQF